MKALVAIVALSALFAGTALELGSGDGACGGDACCCAGSTDEGCCPEDADGTASLVDTCDCESHPANATGPAAGPLIAELRFPEGTRPGEDVPLPSSAPLAPDSVTTRPEPPPPRGA